jgi:hypothetical protein
MQIEKLLKAQWEGMKTKLGSQDVEGAMAYIYGLSQERYRFTFTSIKDLLPDIIANMQGIEMISMRNRVSEYRIKRTEAVGDVTYYIYFLRDEQGLWRILQF